ncbi:MAG TPA: AAA family ATPase [Thermoanaerobaculia bacterium]|nr:AAA family ATPase [Thermoanaerobaculia bacterium]
MITEIEIEGFKSLKKVHLKLGGLNLFIGANASGKSNFFDALQVLQGIGYGLTIEEIFNGKPKSATSEVWEGIRGGSSRVAFSGKNRQQGGKGKIKFHAELRLPIVPNQTVSYSIEILPEEIAILNERLEEGSRTVFDAMGADWAPLVFLAGRYSIPGNGGESHNLLERARPALGQWLRSDFVVEEDRRLLGECKRLLGNVQRINSSPDVLRDYSRAHATKRMGERGENFAALVKSIITDPDLGSSYLSWLRQLTPSELDDVVILSGALGEPLFALKEGEEITPAPILSDGTLRFAALAAAFFQPDMPDIITLEEIENGIHPSRLRLLVELLKSQSGGSGPQVFATTHSPVVLAWLEEKDYETTFLCKRDEETGASIIKPLSEIPHLIDLVRKQPIGELFTEGWLEGTF